ncbi:GMC oxidoreductase [Spirillospora sp. NPDC127200]
MSIGEGGERRREDHRVVIIGAGVGGSVAAFRLAEAGVDNVVLERGRRWPITPAADTFPRMMAPDGRSLWLAPPSVPAERRPVGPRRRIGAVAARAWPRSTGLLDVTLHRHLTIVCGAGVGGGTLVYAGMLPQPRPGPFYRVFPQQLDYGELDEIYYPRARRRLGSSAFPQDLLSHPRYRSNRIWGNALGASGLTAEDAHNAYDFDIIRSELSGAAPPAATIGQYEFTGCNSGAKLSVDRTYLARAEATGRTTVRPLHRVVSLEQDRKGRYRLLVERMISGGAVVERISMTCDRLIMAAGGVHTPRLLVAARDTGALPGLNEHVGAQWGTNADQILFLRTRSAPAGGPQASPPAFMVRSEDDTVLLAHAGLPLRSGSRLMWCLGVGLSDRFGRWTYSPGSGRVRLDWARGSDATAHDDAVRLLRRIAPHLPSGAKVVDPLARHPLTAHPLGGAALGRATDLYGRLHGHPGLYCLDAALMPGSTAAANPALTIAAIAERCLDAVIGDFIT